ncbi:hypothetical protein SAMD00019534_053550 [Acytostelium subglobosum LB1]|uniref:hypothetical protein n=1 Tax=Acytostelium subglobosum LB1 TaxID=1410327 RepID=UPI00064490D4|nr:hypothetical protein SAMD00019534_053550 [Acytostelium subglobosum LB1]GAM22180.1 hypothetical protein SAMD00019534_053550 [Acytostelium subglobosum LB1]|eukprot:XP_012755280.1 hypothetical protein SAMD00019534_053550 [Acytostelium subglobosum LB1]
MNDNVILECLMALLSPEEEKRGLAEQKINEMSLHLNTFGSTLCSLAVNKQVSIDLRQMAAVLLKKHIKEHWSDLESVERDKVKSLLSPALSDPSSKIRTAIAMCIGRVGSFEWPNQWPTLLDDLIKCIVPPMCQDKNILSGALICLEILCDPSYLSESQIQTIIVVLFPVFLQILATFNAAHTDDLLYNMSVHIKIVRIFKNIISQSLIVDGMRKLIMPILPGWMEAFRHVLEARVTPGARHMNQVFTVQTNAIESYSVLTSNYPKQMLKYLPSMIPSLWGLFVGYYQFYEKLEINSNGDDDTPVTTPGSHEEFGITRIDSLVASILEFVTVVIDSKSKQMFAPQLQQIIQQTILYSQMTNNLVELWEDEPSQFLEQEDETSSHPRSIACSLLDRLREVYGKDALRAIYETASALIAQSSANRAEENWWRIREASLLALSTLARYFVKSGDKKYFDFSLFLTDCLAKDFDLPKSEYSAILQGRSLLCASLYCQSVDTAITIPFLRVAVNIIADGDQPVPFKMSALKAIAGFSPRLPKAIMAEFIPAIIQGTAKLLPTVTEDCLLVVYDAILMIIKIDKGITAQAEPYLTPLLLSSWMQYANDPLASDSIRDILHVICQSPEVYPGILQRLLPTLCTILESFDKPAYVGIGERAIDIINLVLANHKGNFDPMLLERIFAPLATILTSNTTDTGILKSSLCAILPFVHHSAPLLATWKHSTTGISGLQYLFQIIEKQLQNPEEFVAMYTPPIITHLIIKLQQHIQPHLPLVLRLSLEVLLRCKLPSFKQALIIIFARMVLLSPAEVVQYLSGINLANNSTALEAVLNEWTKYHADIHSRLDVNISTIGLCKLINLGDVRLEKIMVDGTLLIPEQFKMSRSSARQSFMSGRTNLEKWTKAAFYQKATMVIMETFEMEVLDKKKLIEDGQDYADDDNINHDEDDGDDFDEDEDEDDFDVDKASFAPAEDYEEYLESDDDDSTGFDMDADSVIDKEDPLYHIDLASYIKDFIKEMRTNNANQFNGLAPIIKKIAPQLVE